MCQGCDSELPQCMIGHAGNSRCRATQAQLGRKDSNPRSRHVVQYGKYCI